MTMVYVTNFNNLRRGFQRLVEWLTATDSVAVTVINNASSWGPLTNYYVAHPELKVIYNQENLGPYAFWELGLHKQQTERFIVTDPDLVPSEMCPSALLTIDRMNSVMELYQAGKVGVSLSLDNIPEYFSQAKEVKIWEQQFWDRPTPDRLAYHADIDTTFALYEPGSEVRSEKPSLRLASPYSMDHVPWFEDSSKPNPERDWYLKTIRKDWTHWSKQL